MYNFDESSLPIIEIDCIVNNTHFPKIINKILSECQPKCLDVVGIIKNYIIKQNAHLYKFLRAIS